MDLEKTYAFDFSKEELKDQIVDAYSYDKSLFLKNFGLTLIENEAVNSEYRQSLDVWLDKEKWDDLQYEIRSNTADTLYLRIGKHHKRNSTDFMAIIQGDTEKSSLTIKNVRYERRKACDKDNAFYKFRVANRIDKKFIRKLN